MNTMTAVKIVGGVCGSFLFLLLIKWGAEVIYHPHELAEADAAYVVDTGESTAPTDTVVADAAPSFADIYAAADVAKGAKSFGKCKACHKTEKGKNAVGPSLYGVVGRPQASISDFSYSGAFQALSGTWTPAEMDVFLTSPKAYAPGTKMSFKGFPKMTDRANVIAYLASIAN